MWKKSNINIGTILPNKEKKIIFEYLGDKEIIHVKKTCGCTSAKYNKEDKTITVTFTSGHIPFHLKHLGEKKTKKYLIVRYADNSTDQLSFEATIKSKLI